MRPAGAHARGWGWRHGGRRAWALEDVELTVEPGERVLLLGASGSGKSTLLHALAGVLGDEEGEQRGQLLIDGVPPAAARGRAGLILQDPDAQVILERVGDDIAFACENLGVPREEIWPRVDEAMDAVGLDLPRSHPTAELSGGQKQRLALAGILAMRPGMLLLDEPTANLDPVGVGEIRDAVGRVLDATGATLLVVEHRVEVWLPIVDRVVVLAHGVVVADGPAEAVLNERGEELAAQGVWVPGRPPRHPRPPAAAGDVLLQARDLAVGRSRDRVVASGLSLDVRGGAVTAITGPNGAGKSTLGLTLAGLLRPLGGEVIATAALESGAGAAPIAWSSRQLLTRIGTVLQDPEHQLLGRSVREELSIGPRALGLPAAEVDARIDDLLERMRLAALGAANPYTLSGGEKRRLTVAAAIAVRPRVLVLDEPTFGQDARTWAELVGLIADLRDRDGVGVVAITHDEDVVRALHAERFEIEGPT